MKRRIIIIFIRIMFIILLSKALFYMVVMFLWGLMPTKDIIKDVIESISEIILIIICAYLLFLNAFVILGRKRKDNYNNIVILSSVLIVVLFSVVVQLYNLFMTIIPYSITYHHYVDVLIPHILIILFSSYFVWKLLVNIYNHKKDFTHVDNPTV